MVCCYIKLSNVFGELQIGQHLQLKDFVLHLFNAVTFKDLMRYPSGLSVISSSQCMFTTDCVVCVIAALVLQIVPAVQAAMNSEVQNACMQASNYIVDTVYRCSGN